MRKFFFLFAIVAIAAVAAFNIHMNFKQENKLTTLNLANIEALASESGGFFTCETETIHEPPVWHMTHCSNDGGYKLRVASILTTYKCDNIIPWSGNCEKGYSLILNNACGKFADRLEDINYVSCSIF